MRIFLFVSLSFFLLLSCNRYPYRYAVLQDNPEMNAEKWQPEFEKELYRCTVDGKVLFKRFHLSGLLYFYNNADTGISVLFQNEMGFTYFHFYWNSEDSFQVVSSIPQMDKPALIKTLRKDFEMLLVKNLKGKTRQLLQDDKGFEVLRYSLDKGFIDYYFSLKEKSLSKIINADKKRIIHLIELDPATKWTTLPEHVYLKHPRARFTIQLHKLDTHHVIE